MLIKPATLPTRTAHPGRFSLLMGYGYINIFHRNFMNYTKPAVAIQDQVNTLKARGLVINDDALAARYLSNVSYYRLRAYTYPFQDNADPNHPFRVKVTFEQIIELYTFDRKLRLLLLDAIERIEIAFRTQIVYQWAMNHGSHWHTNPSLYKDTVQFAKHISSLSKEINRSNEAFIKHYSQTYTKPKEPPSWMSLEVSSLGLLSLMFLNLKKGSEKKAVTKHFGITDVNIMQNWIHAFCGIRNICAHHGRIWNRRLTTHIKLPYNTISVFPDTTGVYNYKLYAAVCCMEYVMRLINPESTFKKKLFDLIDNRPNLFEEKEMGFAENWRDDPFWQIP